MLVFKRKPSVCGVLLILNQIAAHTLFRPPFVHVSYEALLVIANDSLTFLEASKEESRPI